MLSCPFEKIYVVYTIVLVSVFRNYLFFIRIKDKKEGVPFNDMSPIWQDGFNIKLSAI